MGFGYGRKISDSYSDCLTESEWLTSKIVEIIGEAAYKITNKFKASHLELPWRQIEGMRHILVHGYFSIIPEVLWDVIENDIPTLILILERYIQEIDEE